ncbi:MAG TPA: hypothetical protein VN924_04870 [Bryobacteraceae bacterium]|nr:hypothetical protein [Bryobacteraceae bacterium]
MRTIDNRLRGRVAALPTILAALILPCAAPAQSTAVLSGQYNNYRTGATLAETTLTPSNISPATFGLLFSQPVDGNIFAQPLYVPGVTINGVVHNVLFAATLNNSVYAFDADTSQLALWHTWLGAPVNIGTSSQPTIGILSTPVIDTGLKVIFVVTFTSESGTPVYRLHALNLLTGVEITNIVVQGAVAGTGSDSQATSCTSWNGGMVPPPCIPFKANELLQRPALLEGALNTTIYMAFGALSGAETTTPYHGWLIGYEYSAGAFSQLMIFNTTTSATQTGAACTSDSPASNQCGQGAGIWMSGRGPAMDATGVYASTGNGGYGGPGTGNWGESALRISSTGAVVDSFTPFNYGALNRDDLDLCDGGLILFTSTNATVQNLMLVAGKTGTVSVLNRASLGGLSSGNAGALQSFTATTLGCGTGPGLAGCYEIHSPAFWNRTSGNSSLYVWAQGDVLRMWDFNPATNLFRADAHQGTVTAEDYPGAGLAVSANGNSDGIVWAIVPTTAANSQVQGTLYAFSAANVTTPLWVSTDYWFPTKFSTPTIANGKVYVPTSTISTASPPYAPAVRIYGLCTKCTQVSQSAETAAAKL